MRWIVLALFLAACGDPESAPSKESPEAAPVDRDAWWTAATKTPLGSERLLAPREWRALLAEGRRRGFDGDGEWWAPRTSLAYERILKLDEDDVEANAAAGRKTLRSLPGFDSLWTRMLEAKVYNEAITELIEQYQPWIDEGRPIFLTEDEVELVTAKMRRAGEHLDRMESDPEYAALRLSLERIPSQLRDYPTIHRRVGPFVVFFAARDLARIEGESQASENERLASLRTKYEAQLAERCQVLPDLLADIAKLYPDLAARYPLAKDEFFFLWIFGDPEWYGDFLDRMHLERPASTHRSGFFQKRDGWGYLFVPRAAEQVPAANPDEGEVAVARDVVDPETQLRETIAYVAAQQLLRHWGRDPGDPFLNRLDRSRAYWVKEGWPAFLASRRVEKPLEGPALREGIRFGREPPPLRRILERTSRIELHRYDEPDPPRSAGEPILNLGIRAHFTDLSWLLVKRLHEDKTRKQFEAFLISQIEAASPGEPDDFARAFGIKGDADWLALEDELYEPLYQER